MDAHEPRPVQPVVAAIVGFAMVLLAFWASAVPGRVPSVAASPDQLSTLARAAESGSLAVAEVRRKLACGEEASKLSGLIEPGALGEGVEVQGYDGPAQYGHGGRYATRRVVVRIPPEREAEVLQALLSIEAPVRWISGRRVIERDQSVWDILFAMKTGPSASTGPLAPPSPRKPGPAGAAAGATGSGSDVTTMDALDLSSQWEARMPELLSQLTRPWSGIRTSGPVPFPAPALIDGLRVERIVHLPSRAGGGFAVVNGILVRPGDYVEGIRVHSVESDRLLLGEGGEAEVFPERQAEGGR